MFRDGWVNKSEDGDAHSNDHYYFDVTAEDTADLLFPEELEAEVDICDDLAITPKSNSCLDEILASSNNQSHDYDIAIPSTETGIVSICTPVSSPDTSSSLGLSTISTIDEIKSVSPRKTPRDLRRPKRGTFAIENERHPTRPKGLKTDAQIKRQKLQKLQNPKSNERVVADYPVNALLGVRIEEGELQYLVNWTPSWEPERNINEPLLREWWLPRIGERWSSVNLLEWVKDVDGEGHSLGGMNAQS